MSLNPDIGTKVTTKKAEKNTYEKKTIESFFYKIAKNQKWKYLHFLSKLLNKLELRSVKHLKLTI